MNRLGKVGRSGGTETSYNFWQLSSTESLRMKTGLIRGIHSAFTGQLLPAKNMGGAGNSTVHKAASGPEKNPGHEGDGSAVRSPLYTAVLQKGLFSKD